ncbi:MAG: thioredoxin family protein [Bacteroidales bacterium]|nr:thioredoxin family protein [Bacteroidales bacterium]
MKTFFKALLLPIAVLFLAVSASAQSTITLTEQTFLTKCYNYNTDEVKCNKPFVIEFGATWCSWCQKQKPVLQKIQQVYGSSLQTFYVDVDNCPQAVSIFDEIQEGIPCLIFVNPETGEYEAINGYLSESDFKQELNELFGL